MAHAGERHEVEHALGERAFCVERAEHPLLDGVSGDEVEHGDGILLVLAPGARDAPG